MAELIVEKDMPKGKLINPYHRLQYYFIIYYFRRNET